MVEPPTSDPQKVGNLFHAKGPRKIWESFHVKSAGVLSYTKIGDRLRVVNHGDAEHMLRDKEYRPFEERLLCFDLAFGKVVEGWGVWGQLWKDIREHMLVANCISTKSALSWVFGASRILR